MKITVNVTEEDIKKGKRDSCSKCPVALAINRTCSVLPGFNRCEVDQRWTELSFGTDEGVEIVGTPWVASDFINAFDDGEPVAPFSFSIDVPEGPPRY